MTESITSSVTAVEEYSNIATETTDIASWRPTDVKHKRNEVLIDVVETMNFCLSTKGDVLRADVDGHIFLRAYLSGTPKCKLVLNEPVGSGPGLYDCRLHQCARSNKSGSTKTISFIPPDGEFQLMSYRCALDVEPPINVFATVGEIATTGVRYSITIKTNFDEKLSTSSLVVKIPTPLDTANVECKTPNGKAKYVCEENLIVWKIAKMQGGSELTLSADATLASTTTKQVWAVPPIDVDFQIVGSTASGINVTDLNVTEKSNYDYHSTVFVKYLAGANGSYQVHF